MTNPKLLPKLARDTGTLSIAFALLVFLFYALRRIDPGATVDGLGNLFVAGQVMIIGFASASTAAAIQWLLFGMPGRESTRNTMATGGVGARLYFIMQRLTWLVLFWLLFSRAVGY